jgi:hypothetical protein
MDRPAAPDEVPFLITLTTVACASGRDGVRMFEFEEPGFSLLEFPVRLSPLVGLLKELGAPRLDSFRLTWLLEDAPRDRRMLCVPWQSLDEARRFAGLVTQALVQRPELRGIRTDLGPYCWMQPDPPAPAVLLFWFGLTAVLRTRH